MKVCLVSYEYPPRIGGEASYTHNLAVGLGNLGHKVVLVVPDDLPPIGGGEEAMIRREAVPVMNLPLAKVGSFMFEAAKRVRRLEKERAIDLVHVTFDYPSVPLRLSGPGVPTVATVHHLHQVEALSALRIRGPSASTVATLGRGMFTTLMERSLVSGADSVIAVSEFTRDSLSRYAGVEKERVSVIPNGIDPTPFQDPADTGGLRRRLGLGSRSVVLYVGRLEPSKGVEYLVRAFKTAKDAAPSACLLIVGTGSDGYSARLRGMAASLGLEGDVVFAGRLEQQNLYEAYASASVMVLPSLMEGFGITLLEAMAAGRPCIGTKVGAIPEVLLPGRAGLLVEPSDVPSLAHAISRVLTNPREARLMGERGRDWVRTRYTVGEMAKSTAALYRKTLGASGPALVE